MQHQPQQPCNGNVPRSRAGTSRGPRLRASFRDRTVWNKVPGTLLGHRVVILMSLPHPSMKTAEKVFTCGGNRAAHVPHGSAGSLADRLGHRCPPSRTLHPWDAHVPRWLGLAPDLRWSGPPRAIAARALAWAWGGFLGALQPHRLCCWLASLRSVSFLPWTWVGLKEFDCLIWVFFSVVL